MWSPQSLDLQPLLQHDSHNQGTRLYKTHASTSEVLLSISWVGARQSGMPHRQIQGGPSPRVRCISIDAPRIFPVREFGSSFSVSSVLSVVKNFMPFCTLQWTEPRRSAEGTTPCHEATPPWSDHAPDGLSLAYAVLWVGLVRGRSTWENMMMSTEFFVMQISQSRSVYFIEFKAGIAHKKSRLI